MSFYEDLRIDIFSSSNIDKLIIAADFNYCFDTHFELWNVLSQYDTSKGNSNSRKLFTFVQSSIWLFAVKKLIYQFTWTHLKSKYFYIIYFIITRIRDIRDISNLCMRSAECDTEPSFIRGSFQRFDQKNNRIPWVKIPKSPCFIKLDFSNCLPQLNKIYLFSKLWWSIWKN